MKVYLGIGSNINAAENIQKTQQALQKQFKGVRFSRTFKSEAVGFDGDDFLNLVAELDYSEPLQTLIEQLKQLEDRLGRVRQGAKFSSRHIDIDILIFGEMVCSDPIALPRQEILANAYVLWPLAELAPQLRAPGGDLTYYQMWQSFDKSKQKLKPVN